MVRAFANPKDEEERNLFDHFERQEKQFGDQFSGRGEDFPIRGQ